MDVDLRATGRDEEEERLPFPGESMVPGTKVGDVARRHAVPRWQVYDWHKTLMAGALAPPAETAAEPMFAALVVEPKPARPEPSPKRWGGAAKSSWVAMVVDGVTLRVPTDIGEAQLTRMICAFRVATK